MSNWLDKINAWPLAAIRWTFLRGFMLLRRFTEWCLKGWRLYRLACVALLALAVAWLLMPPDPDLRLPIRNAQNAAFSADGNRLLIASIDKGITLDADRQRFTLWDAISKTTAWSVITPRGQWAWSPHGRYLAIIDAYSLSLWDAETSKVLKTVNIPENPPTRWTSWGTSPDIVAKTIQELSQIKLRLFPQTVEFVTDDLVVVRCQPEESWRIDLRQRGMPSVCQRRYRTPELEDEGAELWTWLSPNQRKTRSRTLIAREWNKGFSDGGWRLIDQATGRTRVWIAEPSKYVRLAGLSADETLLATGLSTGSPGKELVEYQRRPDDPGVQLYDAETAGLLRSFPDEVNPQFSHEGACLLTQAANSSTLLLVRLRNANNGALLSEVDLSRVALSAGQSIVDRTETNQAIAKGLKPVAVPPPRLASCQVLTTRNASIPFVAIRNNTGTQISTWNRLRRLSAESELIDLTQGKLLVRLPGCHALSPKLDWAVELRGQDVSLWKLQSWRWPLSLKQIGVAVFVLFGAMVLELLVCLWFSWLRKIGAIETKRGGAS